MVVDFINGKLECESNVLILLAFLGIRDQLNSSVKQFAFDFKGSSVPAGTVNLDIKLEEASPARLSGPQRASYGDKMLYIYTSGTTGLPKAVRLN